MTCYLPLKKKGPRCVSLGWRPTLLGFFLRPRPARLTFFCSFQLHLLTFFFQKVAVVIEIGVAGEVEEAPNLALEREKSLRKRIVG